MAYTSRLVKVPHYDVRDTLRKIKLMKSISDSTLFDLYVAPKFVDEFTKTHKQVGILALPQGERCFNEWVHLSNVTLDRY